MGATQIIRYLWQLPQNLIGVVLLAIVRNRIRRRDRVLQLQILYCFSTYGGVSLGRYIFVHRDAGSELVYHELGHCRQSLLLGPLYLPVVGLPSLVWAVLFPLMHRTRPDLDYVTFFIERWANRLAGVPSSRRTKSRERSHES